jgi:hypothetical protein
MLKKSIVIAGSMLVLSLFVTTGVLAATTTTKHTKVTSKTNLVGGMHSSTKGKGMMKPIQNMSLGTVSAVNNSSFTITSKKMGKTNTITTTPTPVTITVNTSSTTIFKKDGVVATSGDLAVGQTVSVNGVKDVSGTIANAISVNINTKPMVWPKGVKSAKTTKPVTQ